VLSIRNFAHRQLSCDAKQIFFELRRGKFKVLRLLPYHCIFNAIENVWGIAKCYYNKHVGRDGRSVENSISLWKESLATVTPQIWANTVRHTEEEIHRWWEREVHFDLTDTSPIIVNLNEDSDSSDEEHLSSSHSD
jgi:transposase